MREDIYGGLKNALEKGEPLEKAVKSFITAGYKESEVQEAAHALDLGTMSIVEPKKSDLKNKVPEPAIQTSFSKNKPKADKSKTILIISLIVLLILVAGGLVSAILYKEQIITFIESLIS